MPKFPSYERDDEAFPADAYRVRGDNGVAWYVLGWELERVPVMALCEDEEGNEWEEESGDWEEQRTGRIVCVMVSDDRRFTYDPEDVEPLDDLAYCAECGQIGCQHDGRDRSEGVTP